jgi:two-component system, cell cycle sensor histidine kinase and response regulator CckA
MVEHPTRTSHTLVRLRSIIGKRPVVRGIAAMFAVLLFWGVSMYLFRAEVRASQVLLFAAILWTLSFLFDRLQTPKTTAHATPTESEQLQSQKMEAIGRLAGGVAHDFNNLLAVISGYSDLLLENFDSSDQNRAKLEHIKQAANSAAALTRQLLMFSRQQLIQPVTLDVNQIVSNTGRMLQRLIKENIEFTLVLKPDLDLVSADPGQIEQVILNLVVNARDAMPRGGKLTIQTSNVRLENGSGQAREHVSSGDFVLLEVADTGTGMDPETQAHIFEPFFTTKAAGKGTGLGLATVYGIVRQNNGTIEVQSTVGRGSSFKIYLPAVKSAALTRKPANYSVSPNFSAKAILVVEDAKPLRDLISEALSRFGCRVLAACNVEEALQTVRDRKAAIDLLLTDVIMPGMDGTALAQEVRSLHPETKVLYMTGHSGTLIRADMLNEDVSLIRKPFTPDELGRKIRKMLAASAENSSEAARPEENGILRKAAAAGSSG